MKRLLTIVSASLLLTACGGGGSKVNKDAKVDQQLSVATMDSLGATERTAEAEKYDDKLIETKGFVKNVKKAEHASAPNKYSFYLCTSADMEDQCTICYTDEDPTANAGKLVTVKGKFSYVGIVTLVDCVVY